MNKIGEGILSRGNNRWRDRELWASIFVHGIPSN